MTSIRLMSTVMPDPASTTVSPRNAGCGSSSSSARMMRLGLSGANWFPQLLHSYPLVRHRHQLTQTSHLYRQFARPHLSHTQPDISASHSSPAFPQGSRANIIPPRTLLKRYWGRRHHIVRNANRPGRTCALQEAFSVCQTESGRDRDEANVQL
jgi:hypothetical protein